MVIRRTPQCSPLQPAAHDNPADGRKSVRVTP
jgi:hypothetical protein